MRKRQKKAMIGLLALALLLIGNVVGTLAAQARVYDDAALFTADEAAQLEATIAGLRAEYEQDFVVVTTADAGGKTAQEYADDFYDNGGFGEGKNLDGMLFLIDMDNREIYVSTSGITIRYLTDERIEEILDAAYGEVVDGNYYAAADRALTKAGELIGEGIEKGQYNYDSETGKISRPASYYILRLIRALLIGAAAGGIACLIVVVSYKSKDKRGARSYVQNFQAGTQADQFLNQTVTHRMIPKTPPPSSSGGSRSGSSSSHRSSSPGRSTTHHSSGGRSHGGGGRKF